MIYMTKEPFLKQSTGKKIIVLSFIELKIIRPVVSKFCLKCIWAIPTFFLLFVCLTRLDLDFYNTYIQMIMFIKKKSYKKSEHIKS